MYEGTHNPEVTYPYDPPNSQSVLEILKEAGEQGILGPTIARMFTIADPPRIPVSQKRCTPQMANLQRRLTWTNQILYRFRKRGWAERVGMERSPYYHNVGTWRWRITESGVEYLAAGMWAGVRAARDAERQRWALEYEARQKRLDDMITQAYMDYDPHTVYKCEREAAIRVMREAGCTLDAIGGVFGVTRERVRQIVNGYKPTSCMCPRCAWKGALR